MRGWRDTEDGELSNFLRKFSAHEPYGFFVPPRYFTEPEFAGLAGLEPVTFHVTGGCSNQLSYNPYS